MSNVYSGIGSRRTPPEVLLMMRVAAAELAQRGWTLRTGGAEGADRAFFEGALVSHGTIELYLPWPSFWLPPTFFGTLKPQPSDEAYEMARQYHRNWRNMRHGARSLHARNAHQVLGADLNEPARFLLCWTPNGSGIGGTGQAIRMAHAYRIPVIDLGRPESRERLQRFLMADAGQIANHA